MSWASRRRLAYITGIILFFAVVVGLPSVYVWYSSIPPACATGTERPPGETTGPCLILNAAYLQPEGVLWARSFQVRPGDYDAVAYIDNPNQGAGVLQASYELDLYDAQNALVNDVTGTVFIMPGGITPVFIGNISTGNRVALHTQFTFTSSLVWVRTTDLAPGIKISDQQYTQTASSSQVTAIATNTTVVGITDPTFVATVFDPNGNAIATSQTALPGLAAGQAAQVYFTWPSAFSAAVGSVDILPVLPPMLSTSGQ